MIGRAVSRLPDALRTSNVAEPVKDDPLGPIITRGLEDALGTFSRHLDEIITATLQKYAQTLTLSRKNGAPSSSAREGGDVKGKSFGDFLLGVARNDAKYLARHYESQFNEWQTKAALAESSGATGGYTVPIEFYQQMLTIMAENTFIRPRAFVQPTGSATLQIPYLDVTTVQSAGTSPFFGAVKMNWTAEAQTRTETEPKFKQLELQAWELSGYSVSSNVLLQDSVIGLEKRPRTLFTATAVVGFRC